MNVWELIFWVAVGLTIAHFYHKPSWQATRALAEDWKLRHATRTPAPRHQEGLWRPRWRRKAAWVGIWALLSLAGFAAVRNGVPQEKVGGALVFGTLGGTVAVAHLLFYAVLAALGRAFREQVAGHVLDQDRAERRGVWFVTLAAVGLVVVTANHLAPDDNNLVGAQRGILHIYAAIVLAISIVLAITAAMRSRDIVRTGVPAVVLMEAERYTERRSFNDSSSLALPNALYRETDPRSLDPFDPGSPLFWVFHK